MPNTIRVPITPELGEALNVLRSASGAGNSQDPTDAALLAAAAKHLAYLLSLTGLQDARVRRVMERVLTEDDSKLN